LSYPAQKFNGRPTEFF